MIAKAIAKAFPKGFAKALKGMTMRRKAPRKARDPFVMVVKPFGKGFAKVFAKTHMSDELMT